MKHTEQCLRNIFTDSRYETHLNANASKRKVYTLFISRFKTGTINIVCMLALTRVTF